MEPRLEEQRCELANRLLRIVPLLCLRCQHVMRLLSSCASEPGACEASLLEWAERAYQRPLPKIGEWVWAGDGSNSSLPNHPNFLLDRLSSSGGGTSSACALEDAKHNLGHPCMRYLLLPKPGQGMPTLESQVARLAGQLGPVFNATLVHALGFQGHMTWKNVNSAKSPKTRQQVKNEDVAQRLRILMAPDIESVLQIPSLYMLQLLRAP